ncbi:hypothetical protein Tco_1045794 [Tanacetum coccineum]|uniref:Uncharacterized protein n=1 Tax=Tanacetum coccineum TaxID=301880 RepID=A0ABQ5GUT7_9ASTR
MLTQQDIYATGSENHPPMLKKDNYVPWSSRLLRYAKSKPNGKLLVNSILHGLYVKRMIVEPGDPDREVLVAKSFHEHTDDELTKKEVKASILPKVDGKPMESPWDWPGNDKKDKKKQKQSKPTRNGKRQDKSER